MTTHIDTFFGEEEGTPVRQPYRVPSLDDVKQLSSKRLFNVISLFAGGGGSSTGYRMAGGHVLAINEFIPAAQDAYRANYPETLIIPDDVREITGESILASLKAHGVDMKIGELDILDGSPPCASFSVAGSREKGWGKVKSYSDKKQRVDDLFFEYSRIVKELQPKLFIAENVKGLTMGNAKTVLAEIVKELESCGYNVAFRVLSSKDYGVPQHRERLIFIGVRKDLNIIPTHPEPTVLIPYTTKDAIDDLWRLDRKDENGDYIVDGHIDYVEAKESKRMSLVTIFPGGTSNKQIREICDREGISVFESSFRRDKWEHPFYTLTQSHRQLHPKLGVDRVLTLNEGKRIMSFPGDYIMPGTPQQNWERLGRAVPPFLMRAIAEHVYNTILKKVNHV